MKEGQIKVELKAGGEEGEAETVGGLWMEDWKRRGRERERERERESERGSYDVRE